MVVVPMSAAAQIRTVVRNAPMLPVLILVCLAFSFLSSGFLSPFSIQNILLSAGVLVVAALGGTLVTLVAGIDLSVGATVAAAGLAAAFLGNATNSPIVALMAACSTGAVIGAINGALIALARFVPFIVTLATMSVVSALAWLSVAVLGEDGAATAAVPILPQMTDFGTGLTFGVPNVFLVGLTFVVLIAIVLSFTRFGRKVYLVGQNELAASFSGLSVPKTKFAVYVIAGSLSGVAGYLLSCSLGSGSPAAGNSLLLPVITAVIIGGTTLTGGHGGAVRTMWAALVIAAVTQGLNALGLEFWDRNIVLGVIVLLGTQVSRRAGVARRVA